MLTICLKQWCNSLQPYLLGLTMIFGSVIVYDVLPQMSDDTIQAHACTSAPQRLGLEGSCKFGASLGNSLFHKTKTNKTPKQEVDKNCISGHEHQEARGTVNTGMHSEGPLYFSGEASLTAHPSEIVLDAPNISKWTFLLLANSKWQFLLHFG